MVRRAIAPKVMEDGRMRFEVTITYDDLLEKLGDISGVLSDLDYMIRMLKRSDRDVNGVDELLKDVFNYIWHIGDRLSLLKNTNEQMNQSQDQLPVRVGKN
ncbi:MAG: hypothetical protein WCE81_13060 [Halobacteriota archaeon]